MSKKFNKDLTVSHLKPAKYNPRGITPLRMAKLQESMSTFGDLSGVVFNVRTSTVISGHQRLKSIHGKKTKIVQEPMSDKFGTVSVGYIAVAGSDLRIPFRSVDWDVIKEKTANIAANAHGGVFDKEKLGILVAEIENSKAFEVEVTGLDPLTLQHLRIQNETDHQDFKEITEADVEGKAEHQCPNCGYQF